MNGGSRNVTELVLQSVEDDQQTGAIPVSSGQRSLNRSSLIGG